jgi:hypothetical protein
MLLRTRETAAEGGCLPLACRWLLSANPGPLLC